jgi:hypothetical protein
MEVHSKSSVRTMVKKIDANNVDCQARKESSQRAPACRRMSITRGHAARHCGGGARSFH